MRLRVDGYETSLCKTSAGGEYEYIEVLLRDMRLIVDIDFKSQFELARPTATYKDLLNSLSQVYVGTEKKLFKIVSLMCSSAKQSYKEMKLHIPPWRTTSYMQAKWHKVSKNKGESENSSSSKCIKWSPPKIKPKRPSGSALTIQFSNMGSINCC
ncbi:hypothetical protein GIB67_025783 [Kingdonia uniflora]|uniref:Ig-like domain-containing protein n=1 Tax=Kingdonia uniflora TaxID=39325 RepID=A0A7J7NSY2_9MAGN|nr:hypothetical protein GIB67_025783 [Kingdonia uniflora]